MRTRMKSFQFFLLRYLFWHISPFFLLRQQTFSSMAVCQIFTFFCPRFAVRTLTRILANKQDLPNALPAAAVTNTLGLPTRDFFWMVPIQIPHSHQITTLHPDCGRSYPTVIQGLGPRCSWPSASGQCTPRAPSQGTGSPRRPDGDGGRCALVGSGQHCKLWPNHTPS